jgi:hypothetical protein
MKDAGNRLIKVRRQKTKLQPPPGLRASTVHNGGVFVCTVHNGGLEHTKVIREC